MEAKTERCEIIKRSPGRPKRSEQAGDIEKQILDQAWLLFMKSGYAAVSINMITQAVGITKPTLYHYFPDKEHLYTAVMCERMKYVHTKITEIIQQGGILREKYFGLAYGFFRFSPMSMGTLMRDVNQQLSPQLVERVGLAHYHCIEEPHHQLIRTSIEQGEMSHPLENVKILADIWLGTLDALSAQVFHLRQDEEKLRQVTETVVSVFLDGVATKK